MMLGRRRTTPRVGVWAALMLSACGGAGASGPSSGAAEVAATTIGDDDAARFAGLALACVHREYPNHILHGLRDERDVASPRQLHPAFYGCYDWHSAVHGHWLLVRLVRTRPGAPFEAAARAALAKSLTDQNLEAELAYLSRNDRAGFERPYGLAWLLQLSAELAQWDDPQGRAYAEAIRPLADLAAKRLATWIPKLSAPIRSGEHSQTAFAFGLAWDWAKHSSNEELQTALREAATAHYAEDQRCPLEFEPSGHDFLSPCLGEADLMRRVLEPAAYASWLSGALPQIPADGTGTWLKVARPSDRADGKIAHLDGLNLSRAWMLDGIAAGLPKADPRVKSLQAAARLHRDAGLAAVTGEHYAGGHWLGSFAVYLTTRRGITP